MAEIRIYEESDAYVYVLLQRRGLSEVFEPETDAQSVVFEVFDPDGVSIGVKDLDTGAAFVGTVEVDGETWGKYRAQFHFSSPGIYEAQARSTGQGGGQVSSRDAIPIENL